MRLPHHVVASSILGGIMYTTTNSLTLAISAVISGVLIDLDHILDYLFFAKDKFSIKNFFTWCNKSLWDRLAVVFHSWELMIIFVVLCCLFHNPILIGTVAGALLHLIMDQFMNYKTAPIHKLFYFLIFRTSKGFRRKYILVERGNKV